MSSITPIEADAPNVVWAIDFQFDSTVDGKAIKIASMIDEHTRESLLHVVERWITAERLVPSSMRCSPRRAAHRRCCGWTTARSSFPQHCNGSATARSTCPTFPPAALSNRLIGVIGFPRHAVSLRFLTVVVRDGICTSHDEGTVRGCGRRRRLAVGERPRRSSDWSTNSWGIWLTGIFPSNLPGLRL